MVCVFELNPCLVTPWFSKPQACFWLRYEAIRALAVDPVGFVLFEVVDRVDIPYPQSFSILVMTIRCRL